MAKDIGHSRIQRTRPSGALHLKEIGLPVNRTLKAVNCCPSRKAQYSCRLESFCDAMVFHQFDLRFETWGCSPNIDAAELGILGIPTKLELRFIFRLPSYFTNFLAASSDMY